MLKPEEENYKNAVVLENVCCEKFSSCHGTESEDEPSTDDTMLLSYFHINNSNFHLLDVVFHNRVILSVFPQPQVSITITTDLCACFQLPQEYIHIMVKNWCDLQYMFFDERDQYVVLAEGVP